MGENLALNIESRGFRVAVFNRTTDKVDAFIDGRAKGKNFIGCHSIEDLVKKVSSGLAAPIYYLAGPPAMVEGMRQTLNRAGINDDDIRSEEFYGY